MNPGVDVYRSQKDLVVKLSYRGQLGYYILVGGVGSETVNKCTSFV